MDPLTHGLLGAAAAVSAARLVSPRPSMLAQPVTSAPRQALVATACAGFLTGLTPDLDVLIRSDADPLLFLEYHRHFTHALAFIPVGALAAALLLYLPMRRHLGLAQLLVACLAGYAVHGVLDACTSYGTQLLWPFSDLRVSWSIIAVIDPLLTLPLLAAVTLAMVRRSRMWADLGLLWVLACLAAGALQRERAEQALRALAEERGHSIVRVEAKPTLFNLLVWRGLYESQGYFYVAAVRPGLTSTQIWSGGAVPRFRIDTALPLLGESSRAARDLHRFEHFSQGWIFRLPDDPWFIGDLRYSMLADSLAPLWGVSVDPDNPQLPAMYENRREIDDQTWARFGCQLRGNCDR